MPLVRSACTPEGRGGFPKQSVNWERSCCFEGCNRTRMILCYRKRESAGPVRYCVRTTGIYKLSCCCVEESTDRPGPSPRHTVSQSSLQDTFSEGSAPEEELSRATLCSNSVPAKLDDTLEFARLKTDRCCLQLQRFAYRSG